MLSRLLHFKKHFIQEFEIFLFKIFDMPVLINIPCSSKAHMER